MRFRLRISITRASGRMRLRSAVSCSSVKPPGCLVVQLDALFTPPMTKGSGSAM